MAQHIGIVGVSPEGAALFYRDISRQAARLMPPDDQPPVTIHNEPLFLYIDAIRRSDWHGVGRLLRRSADLLARCGATFCMSPDNAVQHSVPLAEVGSPIPWLTMADLVAQTIAADGRKKVGLIGTRLVTTGSTYQTHLGLRGIHLVPPAPDEIETLDQIIFSELIYGSCRPESRQAVHSILRRLADEGCEGVILGSSEAPLVVTPENSCMPIYDPSEILAEAAVKRSMG